MSLLSLTECQDSASAINRDGTPHSRCGQDSATPRGLGLLTGSANRRG